MGIGKVVRDDRLEEALGDEAINVDQYPIATLIDKFGLEATIRGIAYMRSLKEADENYKKSADGESYKGGVKDSLGIEGDASEEAEEAVSKWESGMEDGGLGLDE